MYQKKFFPAPRSIWSKPHTLLEGHSFPISPNVKKCHFPRALRHRWGLSLPISGLEGLKWRRIWCLWGPPISKGPWVRKFRSNYFLQADYGLYNKLRPKFQNSCRLIQILYIFLVMGALLWQLDHLNPKSIWHWVCGALLHFRFGQWASAEELNNVGRDQTIYPPMVAPISHIVTKQTEYVYLYRCSETRFSTCHLATAGSVCFLYSVLIYILARCQNHQMAWIHIQQNLEAPWLFQMLSSSSNRASEHSNEEKDKLPRMAR